MGALVLHAGVLRRDHEYFGGKASIPAIDFIVDHMVSINIGFLVPEFDNGLAATAGPMQFIQANGAVPSNAKVGADFYYYTNDSTKTRYFITCNSAELQTALTSTSAHQQTNLAVATSSGYTLQG